MPSESRLRETLDAFVARVREELDARAQDLAAELTRTIQDADAAVRSESDRAMAAERQHLEAQLADERAALAGTQADLERERRQLEERVASDAATLSALRGELDSSRASSLQRAHDESTLPRLVDQSPSTLPRLLDAIRRLDGATTLSGILEALAHGALARASRVAILVVNGDMLKSWGHFGFEPGQGAFDVPLHAVHVLTSALSTQQSAVFRAADGEADPSLPSFMRPPAGHLGLVAPLVVGGQVVAVLYADGAEGGLDHGRAAWADEVELITRHARARLENVTSERTVTALTRSM